MKGRIFLSVIGILFMIALIIPANVFAWTHRCLIEDENGLPVQGVEVTFIVQTGLNQWEEDPQESGANGIVETDLQEHSSATEWEMELESSVTPVNPATSLWELDYMQEGNDVEWTVEP